MSNSVNEDKWDIIAKMWWMPCKSNTKFEIAQELK